MNVDYKNAYIAAYNGKLQVGIKHLEQATQNLSKKSGCLQFFRRKSPKTEPIQTGILQLLKGTETGYASSWRECKYSVLCVYEPIISKKLKSILNSLMKSVYSDAANTTISKITLIIQKYQGVT